MKNDAPIVYFFNNCHNRDHVGLYGSRAFFDLGTAGRQGRQARNLLPGQTCVVAELADGNRVTFTWYSFTHEAILPNENEVISRVFIGRRLASETLPKPKAARSVRYSALFKANGEFKNGSVFHAGVPSRDRPIEVGEGETTVVKGSTTRTGGGFGDSAENKLVETVAIRAAIKAYETEGWTVCSVERDKCGFDLECQKNQMQENVEVKGVRGSEPCFIITAGEVKQARDNANFVLMVVTSALSKSPKLKKYSGSVFRRQFNLSPVQYRAALKS